MKIHDCTILGGTLALVLTTALGATAHAAGSTAAGSVRYKLSCSTEITPDNGSTPDKTVTFVANIEAQVLTQPPLKDVEFLCNHAADMDYNRNPDGSVNPNSQVGPDQRVLRITSVNSTWDLLSLDGTHSLLATTGTPEFGGCIFEPGKNSPGSIQIEGMQFTDANYQDGKVELDEYSARRANGDLVIPTIPGANTIELNPPQEAWFFTLKICNLQSL